MLPSICRIPNLLPACSRAFVYSPLISAQQARDPGGELHDARGALRAQHPRVPRVQGARARRRPARPP